MGFNISLMSVLTAIEIIAVTPVCAIEVILPEDVTNKFSSI